MRNVKIILQYDGTEYAGWQVQDSQKTVQGTLESVLLKLVGKQVKVTGAGRTDAGVHALAQVASFRTESVLEPEVFLRALNAVLPRDIRIKHAEDADPGFHPRYSANKKTYSYLIVHSGGDSVFLRNYAWQLPYCLDHRIMGEASSFLEGEHDFSCFRATGCGASNPVRVIHAIDISSSHSIPFIGFRLEVPVIQITITANAFLRHMVRSITGTLVEFGRGKMSPHSVREILLSKERKAAGPTAPPQGLYLEKVYY